MQIKPPTTSLPIPEYNFGIRLIRPEAPVKKFSLLLISVLLYGLSTSALQLPRGMSPPPPPLDPEAKPATEEVILQRHVDLLQLQKEADDLARTAQTIPSDVANVRKGTLPKDVIQKLKQIEKLSKRLRYELNP